jgi:heme a synthase
MRRLPTLTPRQYERVTFVALVLLFLIILTGAAVRLTGSGLGCPNWPKCGDGIVAPLELNAWIEFGNRLITGLVGLPCIAAFLFAFRREPRRRDLTRLSALLPLGVLAQGILGGLTVIFHLKPGFVMGHFLLSQAILAAAVALWWRARTGPGERTLEHRNVQRATRALLPVGAIVLFAGTVTTAAGPHPGHTEGDDPIGRFDGFGADTLETMYHWHGRSGTVLGLLAVGAWFLARRHGANADLRRALTALCLLVAAQGVVGLVQYELQLPAGLVWIHVTLAVAAWMAVCIANAALSNRVRQPSTLPPDIPTSGDAETRTLVRTP